MRHLEGVGVERGTDWVTNHIIQEELTAIDTDEVFEDSIRSCYPKETVVGWLKLDTVEILKSQDLLTWRIARDEYIDSLEQDEEIISFDGSSNYYWKHELETHLE